MRPKRETPRILLISYHFPPSPAVGGLRIAKFAKYLREFGWETHVLSLDPSQLDKPDWKRFDDFKDIPVFWALAWPTLSDFYLFLKQIWSNLKPWKGLSVDKKKEQPAANYRDNKRYSRDSASELVRSYIFSLFVNLPDNERNWVIPAISRALDLHKKNQYSAILTSCPPFSVHLIGLVVEKLTRVKWISDFRDPWITGSNKSIYYTTDISNKIESWMERKVMHHSSLVYANTARLRNLLVKEYGPLFEPKVCHIPNGYDASLFADLVKLPKYEKFTLSYTGSIYFGRSPEPVFKALAAILSDNPELEQKMAVKLVGYCEVTDGRSTRHLADSYGLLNIVEIAPPVSYQASLEIIARSHVALLFAPNQPFQIPAKVYDYFGCRSDILAIANEGATADLVRSTCSGDVFSPDDVDGIITFLKSCLGLQRHLYKSAPHTEPYEIKTIIRKVAQTTLRIQNKV